MQIKKSLQATACISRPICSVIINYYSSNKTVPEIPFVFIPFQRSFREEGDYVLSC
jgi:hypothetical protein